MQENLSMTGEKKCPVCGRHMKAQRRWQISTMDLLGTVVVSMFLVAVLRLVFQVDVKLLITKGGLVLIGFLIFLMWAVCRYLIRFQTNTKHYCEHCGFDERNI